ncbi:MAG: hypothetical protein ACI8PD_002163, partial [Nitrospinales bacterium]
MKRIKFNYNLLVIVFMAFAVGNCKTKESAEDSGKEEPSFHKPNIVLILSDDQAWNDYGFMGHDVIETPNLDRL